MQFLSQRRQPLSKFSLEPFSDWIFGQFGYIFGPLESKLTRFFCMRDIVHAQTLGYVPKCFGSTILGRLFHWKTNMQYAYFNSATHLTVL